MVKQKINIAEKIFKLHENFEERDLKYLLKMAT